MPAPIASGSLDPNRVPSWPEIGPVNSMTSDPGSISRPAPVAPRPKP
jgi:hypothetical protein